VAGEVQLCFTPLIASDLSAISIVTQLSVIFCKQIENFVTSLFGSC